MPEPVPPPPDLGKIFESLKELLSDTQEDWEPSEVTPDTRLIDLGLESISLVYLIAELQQIYGLGDRLFRKMREDETFLKDMTAGDVVNSLAALLKTAEPQ